VVPAELVATLTTEKKSVCMYACKDICLVCRYIYFGTTVAEKGDCNIGCWQVRCTPSIKYGHFNSVIGTHDFRKLLIFV
jgi:hypothetical protein